MKSEIILFDLWIEMVWIFGKRLHDVTMTSWRRPNEKIIWTFRKSPEIISAFFFLHVQNAMEVRHYFKGENWKSQNRGKIILVPLKFDAYLGLWSSVIMVEALSCALG